MAEGDWHRGVREGIIEFLEKQGHNPMYSHSKQGDIPLYRVENPGERIGSRNKLSDVDIIITEDDGVKYLIEIEKSTRPKHIMGVISATNSINRCKVGEDIFKVKNSMLFIVVKEPKEKSGKPEQLELIKRAIRNNIKKGSISDFIICTENEFQKKFLEGDK